MNRAAFGNAEKRRNVGADGCNASRSLIGWFEVDTWCCVVRHGLSRFPFHLQLHQCDAFVADFDVLDRDVVAGGIHRGAFPFAYPAVLELPAEDVVVFLVL